METYTYEQIIQERKREYLTLMKEIQGLKKYIQKTKYADDYYLKYIGYFGSFEPAIILYVDEHYHLLAKGIKNLMDKLGLSILGGDMFSLNQKLVPEYFMGGKKVIQITDVENFRKDMEKILSSDVALELKKYDIPGIIDQYSLNDYLMVHTSNQTNVTNGNIKLCHDYSPEVLLFSTKNEMVSEENALHLFKEEYSSVLFSDYFRYHVEKQDSLEYQFDDDLKGKNLNCEFLDGTVSKGKILIHKKNNR